jgi:hypothetical protein
MLDARLFTFLFFFSFFVFHSIRLFRLQGCYRVDEFIITQHPMSNTINDFWQMIWNTNASIIVSLYADEKSQVDFDDDHSCVDNTYVNTYCFLA